MAAGLSLSGFTPETYDAIKARIEGKLEIFNPNFDFSPESPDGQLIGVMTYEIFQAWSQLGNVYNTYNPQIASGAGLKNIGLITGLPFGAASRSIAIVETQGTTGTVIPVNSLVTDDDGNQFYTVFPTTIHSNLQNDGTINLNNEAGGISIKFQDGATLTGNNGVINKKEAGIATIDHTFAATTPLIHHAGNTINILEGTMELVRFGDMINNNFGDMINGCGVSFTKILKN